jgi:hypothetical protein
MPRKALPTVAALAAGVLAGAVWLSISRPAIEPAAVSADPQRATDFAESPEDPGVEIAEDRSENLAVPETSPEDHPTPSALRSQPDEDPRVLLFGLVTDAEGHPISSSQELYVAVTDDRGTNAAAKVEDGCYSVAGLAPGDWTLACRKPGFRDFERNLSLDRSETLRREDFVVERAWNIAIQVRTSEGKQWFTPRETSRAQRLGLSAVVTKDSPGERLPPTELTHFVDFGVGRYMSRFDMSGSPAAAELPQDAIGRLAVNVPPPVHVSLVARDFVIETKRVDSPVESLTFTVDPERLLAMLADLVISVVDASTNQPIEGAAAILRTVQSSVSGPRSGPDGLIRFEQRAPGSFSVWILAPGYARETKPFDLEPGEKKQDTIRLSRPNVIAGRVVDAGGQPIESEARLHPYFEGDPDATLAHDLELTVRTDAQGGFAATTFPPGRYLLIFGAEYRNPPAANEPEWTRAPLVVDTTTGPVENLEIVLVRGAELALKPKSKEVVGMKFRISTGDGIPYRQSTFYDANARKLRIAPGAYSLTLIREGDEIRSIPFRLGSDGTTIDIDP